MSSAARFRRHRRDDARRVEVYDESRRNELTWPASDEDDGRNP